MDQCIVFIIYDTPGLTWFLYPLDRPSGYSNRSLFRLFSQCYTAVDPGIKAILEEQIKHE